jgi:hypothetical protein
LRTITTGGALEQWIWNDEDFCTKQQTPYNIEQTKNPLQCYFGNVFTPCADDSSSSAYAKPHVPWIQWKCPKYVNHPGNITGIWDLNSAATEYLFSQVNPAIINLVEQEALKIFGSEGAPEKMITIHIR